jgi:hypothetical protein
VLAYRASTFGMYLVIQHQMLHITAVLHCLSVIVKVT